MKSGLFQISKLTFGSDDAELDEKRGFLDKVFLKTSLYSRAIGFQRELVVGRKGTGKSAICLTLKKAFESDGMTTILITPQSLSQQKIEQLRISSINNDESYILSWKYALLVKIGLEVLNPKMSDKVTSKVIKSNKEKIRKFLATNGEIDSTFLQKLGRGASIFSKLSVKAYGVEGGLETRQLEVIRDTATELEKFQQSIELVIAELSKTKIVLLIDRVDEVWNQTEEAEMMIIGLIKAIHDLNFKLKNAHAILFLRSDIYDILKFHDSDKYHSLEERIKWDDNDLKHLIATRGKVSAKIISTDQNKTWNMIFEEKIDGRNSFEYILERTMKRPRELIQFCNIALTEAQDNGHVKIQEKDIESAEKQYSNWKLKDLSSEFAVQYPYLEELLGLFQGFKSEFSRKEFDLRYKETQIRLKPKHPDLATVSTDRILQILYIIGFLGIQKSDKMIFSYDDPLILLSQEKYMVVHPAFYYALGLHKSTSVSTSVGGIYVGGNVSGSNIVVGNNNVVGDIVGRDKVVQEYYEPRESIKRELNSLLNLLKILEGNLYITNERIAKRGMDASVQLLNEREQYETDIAETKRKIIILEADLSKTHLYRTERKKRK